MNLTDVRADLRRNLDWLGAFASTNGQERLDNAILAGLWRIWSAKEWDFKWSQQTLSTTAGNKGPYDPASDYYVSAPNHRLNRFMYFPDIQTIAPIADTDTRSWDLYLNQSDGKFYFRDDPDTSTLTVNYQAKFNRDRDDLTATLLVYPDDLFYALEAFVTAEIRSIGNPAESMQYEQKGFALVDVAWADYIRGKERPTVRGVRGINGVTYDGIATSVQPHNDTRMRRRF